MTELPQAAPPEAEPAPPLRERWRRWVDGPARMREGNGLAAADLAVVVIGFKAQEDLAAAVASLRAQEPAEILVVNTGGGPARERLAAHLDHIRLIEVDAPLFVGAARNIGIDASRAPYVAFLAGDCSAAPNWVAARLAAHRSGARAVASPVAPPDGAGYWSRAAHLFLFGSRAPQIPAAMAQRYGASYDRRVFAEAGYYNPALRIGEDSDFVERLGKSLSSAWARQVVTIHPGPATFAAYIHDLFGRGQRTARYHMARRKGWLPIDFLRHARSRYRLAFRLARDGLRLPATELGRMRPGFALGALAHAAGVQRGFFALDAARAALKRSEHSLRRGDLPAAIAHARVATARNGEDLATLLHLADLLHRDPAEAARLAETLRWVGRLCAFRVKHQLAFCDWLLERNLIAEAAAFADLCRIATPAETAVHVRLANYPGIEPAK